MKMWTIGQVAAQSGVPATTIRYYEKIGLLPPAIRDGGQRRYDEGVLQQLGVIRMAQQAGFSIAEAHTLLNHFGPETPPLARWQALATRKLAEVEAQMHALQRMQALLEQTLQCQCATLEECANHV